LFIALRCQRVSCATTLYALPALHSCAVLQEIQAKVAAQGEESKKVLELNAALAQENALLRARTDELNALLEESHSKVEKLSGLQRQQLEGLQKKLDEQVRSAPLWAAKFNDVHLSYCSVDVRVCGGLAAGRGSSAVMLCCVPQRPLPTGANGVGTDDCRVPVCASGRWALLYPGLHRCRYGLCCNTWQLHVAACRVSGW
jgi:hypothetical protein